MSRFVPDPEVLRLGEALAALRRERGLSQAEAGARLAMTSQGWGLYESGRRSGLFRPDIQRRLTGALDATPEDLALRLAAPALPAAGPVAATGVESRGRGFVDALAKPASQAPAVRRLQLSDDALSPWAASGVVLEYAPGLWPRRGQGCVIQMDDGALRVRLYEQADAEAVEVRGGAGLDRTERIARERIVGVSAVTARLER